MLQHSLDSCALVTCTAGLTIPSIFTPHARASERFWEFFTVNIRNRNTRQAYYHAVSQFARWCEVRVIHDLATVRPMHVAAHIEHRLITTSKPTVKTAPRRHPGAIRLGSGRAGHGDKPRCVRARPEIFRQEGQDAFREQTRELLDSVDPGILVGKRDGALIALMTYTFARVSAATYGIKQRGQEKR